MGSGRGILLSTDLACSWRFEKLRKTLITIFSVPARIHMGYLLNTSEKRYCWANLLLLTQQTNLLTPSVDVSKQTAAEAKSNICNGLISKLGWSNAWFSQSLENNSGCNQLGSDLTAHLVFLDDTVRLVCPMKWHQFMSLHCQPKFTRTRVCSQYIEIWQLKDWNIGARRDGSC